MIRPFVLIYGIAFLVVAVLGLATHGMSAHQGELLGVFPINGLHNLVHLLIGVAGLLAYFAGEGASRAYARVVGVVYLLVAILGLVSPSGLGLMPIGGADIVLHFLAAGAALYFGFAAPSRAPLSARTV
jgi:hypothetical protein